MSTLVDVVKSASYEEGHIVVVIEVSPFGLHWPDLDEDLSFRGLLEGDYGQSRACRT